MTERITVTSTRRRRPPVRRRAATVEIDEQTRLGEVYMRSLLRAQLRLGLSVAGVVFAMLAAIPAMFALVPALAAVEILGLPIVWIVLGGLVYPGLIVTAWFYVRHAERNERDFADLVNRR
jgi:hypothetical protein